MESHVVREALEIARYYPSGENCQCFQFRFDGQRLYVDYVAQRASHALIYDASLIALTLGGLAEYLRNAFAALGYHATLHFDWEAFDCHKDHAGIATLGFDRMGDARSGHITDCMSGCYDASTLRNRVTDRRPYHPPNPGELSAVVQSQRWHYMTCHVQGTLSEACTSAFAQCESHIWQAERIVRDITSAIHFEGTNPQTGLPWNNLGVSRYEVLPIKWVKSHPWLIKAFERLGMQRLMYRSQLDLWRSGNAGIVFTYHPDLSLAEKTLACMEMMQCVLGLTQAGFAVQPSTITTEVLNIGHKPVKNICTEAGYTMPALAERSQHLRTRLALPDHQEVAWVLRVGRPTSPFPAEARTHRMSLDQLLTEETAYRPPSRALRMAG